MSKHVSSDDIRSAFSAAMSAMYRTEVPQYATLMELVADVNREVLTSDPTLHDTMTRNDEIDRLGIERHGAIRLGTAEELFNIRRVFAVMGMFPVGYYDLSVAGVPVHSTAFRPIDEVSLRRNPFRVFTSLLRLELIEDDALRAESERLLAARQIFSRRALELVAAFERIGGLTQEEAHEFVRQVLEAFRWHSDATVTLATYEQLHDAHRLIADVVSFKGPHINHLTPRTLDIDAVQARMATRGITPKAVIEGPPRRTCDILLRQTSFKALEEAIVFKSTGSAASEGSHTARFGEIEQRGVALTPKGRKLYDELLDNVRSNVRVSASGESAGSYDSELAARFTAFPDDWVEMRRQGLAFFRFTATEIGEDLIHRETLPSTIDGLVDAGFLHADPIIYEDFLPVSAAGIFQSNLGADEQQNYGERSNRASFEISLGTRVNDEFELYRLSEERSLEAALAALGHPHLAAKSYT